MVRCHAYEIFRIGKSIETESKLVVAGARVRANGELLCNGHGVFFWSDENVLKHDKKWWLHSTVNVLQTTGLHTLKWLICLC